jgi:hypothetical protein
VVPAGFISETKITIMMVRDSSSTTYTHIYTRSLDPIPIDQPFDPSMDHSTNQQPIDNLNNAYAQKRTASLLAGALVGVLSMAAVAAAAAWDAAAEASRPNVTFLGVPKSVEKEMLALNATGKAFQCGDDRKTQIAFDKVRVTYCVKGKGEPVTTSLHHHYPPSRAASDLLNLTPCPLSNRSMTTTATAPMARTSPARPPARPWAASTAATRATWAPSSLPRGDVSGSPILFKLQSTCDVDRLDSFTLDP